jgi:hypothetical protein
VHAHLHLVLRDEIAHPHIRAGDGWREQENAFVSVLADDGQHVLGAQTVGLGHHGVGIAAARLLGEDTEQIDRHGSQRGACRLILLIALISS